MQGENLVKLDMPHTDRRKEVGKALIDIGKYSFTAGIVGSAITDKWTLQVVVICAIISLLAFIIGFYTIPENKKE